MRTSLSNRLLFSHINLSHAVADSDYEEDQTDEDGILRETFEARFKKNVAVNSW
jgi:hypothetical protein